MTFPPAASVAIAPRVAPGNVPRCDRVLNIVRSVCVALLLLLGAIVLFGWLSGAESLLTILPGRTTMKPNTALLFFAAGVALALSLSASRAARRAARIVAVLIALIGLLTLFEYLFHTSFGIDEFLLHDPYQHPFPGRMAPITAINFVLAGALLLLVCGSRLQRIFGHILAFFLAIDAFTTIVGYLYGVSVFYGSGSYTSMAFHTGIGFLILAVGALVSDPNARMIRILCAPETGGWLLRRTLAAMVILPIALGWAYLQGPLEMASLRFGLALFAVTVVGTGVAALFFVAYFLNRSARQRAEIERVREQGAAALAKNERELRLLTDLLPTLIAYIDIDGRFVRANATYERWTGKSRDTLIGRTPREVLGDDYAQRTQEARDRALAGQIASVETEYPTLNGNRRVQVTYAPDLDENNRLRGMVGMVLDVDDQRHAEAALRQSEKLAVVGRLASSIAHEINNPLEAVTNLLYLAAQDAPPGSPQLNYVTLAQQELARVTHIVVQTLRFHRQATNPTECNLSEIASQVLALYQGRLNQARIEVHPRFRPLPPLLCREGEIRQVLANLIGNAADAMSSSPEPGGRLLIRTRPSTDPHTGQPGITITVADTGHGIPAEVRKHLFEPFHTTKGITGSGLGLWVSQEIVERHGGRIAVRSAANPAAHGTVFTIFLAQQPDLTAA